MLRKKIKCSESLVFYLFYPTCLINSINHEHSCNKYPLYIAITTAEMYKVWKLSMFCMCHAVVHLWKYKVMINWVFILWAPFEDLVPNAVYHGYGPYGSGEYKVSHSIFNEPRKLSRNDKKKCWQGHKSLTHIYIFEARLFFLHSFMAPWITQIWLTAAKLTCLCNTLQTSNSFPRSDTGVVTDSEPQNKPLVCSIGCLCSRWLFCFSVLHFDKTMVSTITY